MDALHPAASSRTSRVANPLQRIAILGNHLPRRCGIATFTTDLAIALAETAPQTETFVLAMNDAGHRYAYPPQVRFEIAADDPGAYARAGDYLGVNGADVLSVQHEFGIFGGEAGADVLPLLRSVRVPVVTTLHTILGDPSPAQADVITAIAAASERLVVMSAHGSALLQSRYAVPAARIDLIPHGAPRVQRGNPAAATDSPVLLTFGLMSPDKGIEYALDAMPAILARHPGVTYVVLGATHPHVLERDGEAYRDSLEARALALGVAGNVRFVNRFVAGEELVEFLAAATICLTPYLNREQITSGALAYAIAAGKAVISTPYRYATEMLDDGRGVLVPWRDSSAIAREVIALLDDDDARTALTERAAARGAGMDWPTVAGHYLNSFVRARDAYATRRRHEAIAVRISAPAELPAANLAHVRLLSDETGMLQHAHYAIPRYEDGYCLDDNARALLLMARLDDEGTDDLVVVRALASRYLAFVRHAFDGQSGRFRNFMTFAREWSEVRGSEDSHGRALWALGTVVGRAVTPGTRSVSSDLFHAALPATAEFTSPRAWAYALLGIDEYLRAFAGESGVEGHQSLLAERLFGLYRRTSRPEWPWFEDRVTYANARLPQALIVSGARMGRTDISQAGLASLTWLLSMQRSPDGHFAPIGSTGFGASGTVAAAFDQQPVEACGMVAACVDANRATGDAEWLQHARRVFNWFLGENDLQLALYDAATGGCHDGLHADRVNRNQGAESTLSMLLALLDVRAMAPTVPEPTRELVPVGAVLA
jgi:glycosyltransferase involved in cell wall biosynthesis